MPNGIVNRAEKVTETWKVKLARRRRLTAYVLKHLDDFRGWHSRSNTVNRRESYRAIPIDDENGRLRDAAFLASIINIPLLDHAPLRVGKDRKRQLKFSPDCFRFLGWINRNCDEVGTGRANFAIVLPVLRQLAKTKRSPMPSIKQDNKRAAGGELG